MVICIAEITAVHFPVCLFLLVTLLSTCLMIIFVGRVLYLGEKSFPQPQYFCTLVGVTTTSYALGDIPAFHDGAGACCGKASPIGGTSGGNCMGVR